MTHFADRLADAVRTKGNPLCVGLDPRWDSLPQEVRKRYDPASRAAAAGRAAGGVFVLVRTSNPGAGLFQDLLVARPGEEPRPLYQHVGAAVAGWARENLGACGLGDVGAVAGATYPAELALLRKQMPEVVFLVPGYGAQGGGAADVAGAFRPDGLGAVVNSSRGILFPFKPNDPKWEQRVEETARAAAAALAPLSRRP